MIFFFWSISSLHCRVCSHRIDFPLLCGYLFRLLDDIHLWFSAARSRLYPGSALLCVEGLIRQLALTSFLNQLTSQTAFPSSQPFKRLVPPPLWAGQPDLNSPKSFLIGKPIRRGGHLIFKPDSCLQPNPPLSSSATNQLENWVNVIAERQHRHIVTSYLVE